MYVDSLFLDNHKEAIIDCRHFKIPLFQKGVAINQGTNYT